MNPSRVRPHTLRVSEMDDSGYLFSGNLKKCRSLHSCEAVAPYDLGKLWATDWSLSMEISIQRVCVYTAIHMQKTTTGHLMTMHVMFSEFMRQRLCTLCFPNSCAKDYLTAGGCRECHSSAANEDGYDILWYRSGTLDRRTCLIMSFHFRDGMWLTQEPPCRLMIWTWFHLFIKDDGLRNSTRHVQPHRHCSSLPKINSVH